MLFAVIGSSWRESKDQRGFDSVVVTQKHFEEGLAATSAELRNSFKFDFAEPLD